MKKYNITVNGTAYEVVVEEVSADGAVAAAPVYTAPAAPVAAAAPKAAPTTSKAPAPAGAQGSIQISAPMPGTVVKVNVTTGAAVKKGDTLCVLEAMKMENEIKAPENGTVASVNVQSGASVSSGQVLITLN